MHVRPSVRLELLRGVLVAYGVGHLVTTALFFGWPRYFLEGTGPRPPWPLSVVQFGSWPPTHEGFLNVLAAYDLAVAAALFLAATKPLRHTGIIAFAVILWLLHGGVHAYHVVWGTSPRIYMWSVVELWLGAALLTGLVAWVRPAFSITRTA